MAEQTKKGSAQEVQTARPKKVTFTRELGSNAPNLIADLVVSGTIPAIEELVANSYDADATRVEIEYNPREDYFIVRDNGTGMVGRDELSSFYRLGDSPKIENPISPSGRARIGKFGVATILVRSLCREYDLNTWRDGRRTTIHESLEDRVTSTKPITGEEILIDDRETHGTELAMRGLKFNEDSNFSLDKLRRRIQWDLPILPDFEICINGEKVSSKSIEHSTTFKIDTYGGKMGKVSGNIYLTNRESPMSGIHVYVNGRSIGDPKALLEQLEARRSISRKIIGIIKADGLEDAILFDRGRFREDHPGVVEMEQMFKKAVNKVRHYAETSFKNNYSVRVGGQRDALLKKAVTPLISNRVMGLSKDTQFDFSDDMEIEIPGRYDESQDALYLNAKNPALAIDASTTPQRYERALLEALVDTVALHIVNNGEAELDGRISLPAFLRQRGKIWDQIISEKPAEEKTKRELHSMIVYQPGELARYSGRNIGAIRGMIESGILKSGEEGVVGGDFLDFEQQTNGLVSLYEATHKRVHVSALTLTIDRYNKVLELAGESARPFAYDLSTNGDGHFYFIEGAYEDKICEVFKSQRTDLRRSDADPSGAFANLGEEFYAMPELAEHSTGLTVKDVGRVLTHAKKRRLQLQSKNKGRGVVFYFRDFVRALQDMRGNNGYTTR